MIPTNLSNNIALDGTDALEHILSLEDDSGPEPNLPPHVATFLGEQLQAYYTKLMSETVPDRFVQLLQQLDRKGNGRNGD